jgi:hypothetical protein
MEEGEGEAIKFKLESIDLELKVAAKKVDKKEGGIKFYLFNFGAGRSSESEHVQTIKLKMVPESSGGGPLKIARETVERPLTPGDSDWRR